MVDDLSQDVAFLRAVYLGSLSPSALMQRGRSKFKHSRQEDQEADPRIWACPHFQCLVTQSDRLLHYQTLMITILDYINVCLSGHISRWRKGTRAGHHAQSLVTPQLEHWCNDSLPIFLSWLVFWTKCNLYLSIQFPLQVMLCGTMWYCSESIVSVCLPLWTFAF